MNAFPLTNTEFQNPYSIMSSGSLDICISFRSSRTLPTYPHRFTTGLKHSANNWARKLILDLLHSLHLVKLPLLRLQLL